MCGARPSRAPNAPKCGSEAQVKICDLFCVGVWKNKEAEMPVDSGADDALFLQIMMMDSMWLDGHQQAKLDSSRPRPSGTAARVNRAAVEVEELCEVSSRSDCTEGTQLGACEPWCNVPASTNGNSREWEFLQHQGDIQPLCAAKCIVHKREHGSPKPFIGTGDSEVFRQIMGEPAPTTKPEGGPREANGAAGAASSRSWRAQEVAGARGGGFSSSLNNIRENRPQRKQLRKQMSHNGVYMREKTSIAQASLSREVSGEAPSFSSSRESSASLASLDRETSGGSEPMGQPLGRLNKVFQNLAVDAADFAAGADAPACTADIDGISGIEFVRGDKSMTAAATLSLMMRLESLEAAAAATSTASGRPETPQGAPGTTASSDSGSFSQPRGVVSVQSSCGQDETDDEGEPQDRENNVAGNGKRRHVSSSDEEVEAGAARKDVEAAKADAVVRIFPENAARALMLHGHPQPFPKNSRQGDEDRSPRGSWNRHLFSLHMAGEARPESPMSNMSSPRGSWIHPSSSQSQLRRSDSPMSERSVENGALASGVSSPVSRRFSQELKGFGSPSFSPLSSVADVGRRRQSSPASRALQSPAVRAGLRSSWFLSSPIEDLANAHQAGEKAAQRGDGDDEALNSGDGDGDGDDGYGGSDGDDGHGGGGGEAVVVLTREAREGSRRMTMTRGHT